jgi:Subtilase family
MKRFFVAAVVLSFAAVNAFAADGKVVRSARPAKGHYIVMLNPQGTSVDLPVQALTRAYGGDVRYIFRGAPWEGYAVHNLPETAALALSRDPRVMRVEEDGLAELLQTTPQHEHWALDRTNQRTLPLDNLRSAGCVGTYMVHIYIMDSGINDPNGAQFGSRLIHGYVKPGVASSADTHPYPGHGTLVANIAGGATYGVAPDAKIVNVKVAAGTNVASDSVAAIRDFINTHVTNGPKVVNMSLLYPTTDGGLSALEWEIQNSINTHQITYVVGAGNGVNGYGINACNAGAPARMGPTNGVITVGATYLQNNYTTDERSEHPTGDGVYQQWASNTGPCVDLFAPGTRVASVDRDGNPFPATGTSAATPYVAGAAARRQAIHWSSYGTIKLPADVEAALKADATPNVINPATIGAGSPNLLLYRFYLRCRAVSH